MLELTPFERGTYDWMPSFRDFERRMLGGGNTFRTDIRDSGDAFTLEAELPGFSRDEIQVDVESDCLKISAVRSQETQQRDEKGYLCRERSQGSYSRSFRISGIRTDDITASYQNGILHLNLPKQQEKETSSRRLEIQ